MPAMKLYMTPGSCSTGIHIILEELQEEFEANVVDLPAGEHFKADFIAINPKSTIPTLVRKDGTALTEVPAIAYWLGRSNPSAGLWPDDVDAESRAIEAMAYIVGTIHGQGFARVFGSNSFSRHPGDHASMHTLGWDIIEKGFAVLNRALGSKTFVTGRFSVADAILFYVEFWAERTRIPLPQNLAAHYRRMLGRPAVERALREEGYDPAGLGKDIIDPLR